MRINLSHGSLKQSEEWLTRIQTAHRIYREKQRQSGQEKERSDRGNMSVKPEILMDLQGPELRIGTLEQEKEVREGDYVLLCTDPALSPQKKSGMENTETRCSIPVPELLFSYLKDGTELLLDDGKLLLQVEKTAEVAYKTTSYSIKCRVLRGGMLKSRKSIAVPGVAIDTPTLTACDLDNISQAQKYGITGVMLPFVRGKEDLIALSDALRRVGTPDAQGKNAIRIFAKIENMDGVRRLPELLPYCDEIVIARGDLGNAMPLWELPVVQEEIAAYCRKNNKPFMVVTQMLASMEHAPVPTRAEVSDIFRAVNSGASSVMVTGETAAGEYPVEVMEYLANTVRAAERGGFLDDRLRR